MFLIVADGQDLILQVSRIISQARYLYLLGLNGRGERNVEGLSRWTGRSNCHVHHALPSKG
jgi:hypothetical protein